MSILADEVPCQLMPATTTRSDDAVPIEAAANEAGGAGVPVRTLESVQVNVSDPPPPPPGAVPTPSSVMEPANELAVTAIIAASAIKNERSLRIGCSFIGWNTRYANTNKEVFRQ